jgi:hypothetical protein
VACLEDVTLCGASFAIFRDYLGKALSLAATASSRRQHQLIFGFQITWLVYKRGLPLTDYFPMKNGNKFT